MIFEGIQNRVSRLLSIPFFVSINVFPLSRPGLILEGMWRSSFFLFILWGFSFKLLAQSDIEAPSVEASEAPEDRFQDPFENLPEDPTPDVEPGDPVTDEGFSQDSVPADDSSRPALTPVPSERAAPTPAIEREPQVPVIDSAPTETVPSGRRPLSDPFSEEPFRRSLEPEAPTPVPTPAPQVQPRDVQSPDIKEIESDRDFIERNRPRTRGPKSSKFDRAEKFTNVAPTGTWNMAFEVGPAFNINRRPSQVAFQIEGGYRIWKTLDLNGLMYFRARDDRVLGFQFLPTWTFPKLFGSIERFDVRAGMGMGWSFRGIRGSDFQIGYFSMRATAGLYYYLLRNLSLNFSLDIDSFLYRVDTGGDNATNELSGDGGPPLQWIPHFGVKFEFL